MTEAVLDASVILKWFRQAGEERTEQAHALRARFEAGTLTVFAPPLLFLELLNVAAWRWRWSQQALTELATHLERAAFELQEPDLPTLAKWVGRGLTAYDATYVALAEMLSATSLLTTDARLAAAPGIQCPVDVL